MKGVLAALFVWFAVEAAVVIYRHFFDRVTDPAIDVFSSIANLLLLHFSWGLVCRSLRKVNINYLALLELPLRTIPGELSWTEKSVVLERTVLKASQHLSLVFATTFILYSRATFFFGANHFISNAIPSFLMFYILYHIFFPIDLRRDWLAMLQHVFLSPFSSVSFRDSFVGDVLTSIVRVIIPLTMSILYLSIAFFSFLIAGQVSDRESLWWQHHILVQSILLPLITLYPLCIRLFQCLRRVVETGHRWPHMANAAKYASALLVSSLGTFNPTLRHYMLWRIAFVAATLYQYVWDITMDWGLLTLEGSQLGLRSVRLLGPYRLYIVIAILNFILRFAWSLTLLPEAVSSDEHVVSTLLSHIEPVVASLEICRRMGWAILRVEWEHIESDSRNAEQCQARSLSSNEQLEKVYSI